MHLGPPRRNFSYVGVPPRPPGRNFSCVRVIQGHPDMTFPASNAPRHVSAPTFQAACPIVEKPIEAVYEFVTKFLPTPALSNCRLLTNRIPAQLPGFCSYHPPAPIRSTARLSPSCPTAPLSTFHPSAQSSNCRTAAQLPNFLSAIAYLHPFAQLWRQEGTFAALTRLLEFGQRSVHRIERTLALSRT